MLLCAYMKKIVQTTILLCALVVAAPAVADEGMLSVTMTEVDIPAVTSTLSVAEQILLSTELVQRLSYLAALQAGIPPVAHDDEGLLTVVVNENMIAPCALKDNQVGEQCVRHQGQLGLSTIDLATIENFFYNDQFTYDLTLMRSRSEAFGDADEPRYDYLLVRIERVEFNR